jgi:predicted TIM-barrel fold metal-dependent hydrolase
MIIDADTHISGEEERFSLEAHMEEMDRARVDKTLCWLSPHHYHDSQGEEKGNRYVAEAFKKYPEKIIGFGWADPTFGLDHAKKMASQCIEEWGMKGVKMNGAQNNYYIDDPETGFPLAEHIARLGCMLAFHIGPDAYEKTHPYRAARIAKAFPETPILMVHMGMTDPEMNKAVLDAARQCPNMYLVGSATHGPALIRGVETLGAERILFGSDRPFQKMAPILTMYQDSLKEKISQRDWNLIMGGNGVKLFS